MGIRTREGKERRKGENDKRREEITNGNKDKRRKGEEEREEGEGRRRGLRTREGGG